MTKNDQIRFAKMLTNDPEYWEQERPTCDCPPTPCSPLPLADCDCDPDDDPSPMETYRCAECEEDVAVCLGCYQIRNGCDCGHCEDGATFIEE